jgi:acyl transferase domain-containing protein/acyl carrier protein
MTDSSSSRISPARLALAARTLREERDDLDLLASDPIAVIGMACRFPGKSDSPEEYWAALMAGRSGMVEMPESRWRNRAELEPPQRLGGFLDSIDGFDAEFFGIAPREANEMDPQHRFLLEVVWEALWDACIEPASLAGGDTGVFAASYNTDYARMHFRDRTAIGAYAGIATAHSVAAGRISFLLDLRGPSVVIDTACSSSLVATHTAVRSLRSGDCRMAIVGASSLKVLPDEVLVFSRWGMLAGDGKCKTFDAAADGFGTGEGAGAVILKRLSDALQDGDRIRAVIRGTAINHDGRTTVLTAPSGLAQQAVIRAALQNARVEPTEISYVEAHGTGTSLGDPIEVEALQAVYGTGEDSADRVPCVLGAVKTNLGHLEAAAGLAGLIKAVLCLENGAVPGNLHFHTLNPQISLEGSRFVIPTETVPWPRAARARVAGVSSFGVSGTNAHVIVEEAPVTPAGRARAPLAKRRWKRERCWLPEPAAASIAAMDLPREPVLHPLLGRAVPSGFVRGHLFEAQIGTDTVAYLRDHNLGDRSLLPFAGFLEMAHAAGKQTLGNAPFAILDFAVDEPLFVEAEGHTVQTLASGTEIEIAGERNRLWVKHARGSLRRVEDRKQTLNLAAVRARCCVKMEPVEFYPRLESTGLRYGPAFRAITSVWHGTQEGLALLRVPEELGREATHYALHPALLDGCLQAVLAALPETSGDLLLPIAVEEFQLLRAGLTEVWAHVTLRAAGPDRIAADVSITDDAGVVVAFLRGFQAKRVAPASVIAETQKGVPVYEIVWRAEALPVSEEISADSRRWLLVESTPGSAAGLSVLLAGARSETTIVPPGDATRTAHVGAWTDVVLHLNAGEAIQPDGAWEYPERSAVAFVIELVRSLRAKRDVPRLWVVASGAAAVFPGEDVSLAHAPLAGLLRTLACEHPATAPALIDFDSAGENSVHAVAQEMLTRGSDPLVAIRRGSRYVARLTPAQPLERRIGRLASGSPGVLDALRWEPADRPAPGPGEIEIEVRTHGLNFRDVLNALGVFGIEHPRFGGECAGIVARVGESVRDFAPGDRVLAFAPFSLQSYAVVPEFFAAPLPSGMTFAQAATVPVAFLTAEYGLRRLARLTHGQRALIHAAAGGLGLAAVQVARRVGAEIYATAGSERKREFLRRLGVRHVFDSRSPAFRDDVLQATSGRGVDVVLNSLSGELIQMGLETLAPNGCFLEVGKRGIWTPEQVRAFRSDVRYYAFDVGEVAKADPESIHAMLVELMREFAVGSLEPLPTVVYRVDEAAAAFRMMAQAGHIGKIVLSRRAEREGESLRRIVARGTTLVVGGLGPLGSALAEWLAARGARRLVLAGRSGNADPALVASLQAAGAEVEIARMDVANPDSVEEVLGHIRASGVPLTAVFHAAGVVRDRVLEGESWDTYRQAAAVKIEGAWNLHRLTQADPVEMMVFFSSAAGVLGSAGQGSYAAGNTFLDSLAQYRTIRGLATLSVDWGAWAAAGMAARLAPEHAARLDRQGIHFLEADGALAAMEKAIAEQRSQVAVLDIAWDRFLEGRAAADEALFAELRPRPTNATEPTEAATIRDVLLSAPDEERKAVMAVHVRDCARRALSLAPGATVHDDVPLQEIGLDSLMAIDMKNELAQSLHVSLPAGLLFNYPTIGELTRHLLGLLPAAISLPATDDAGETGDLQSMSDEEAERLLLEELDQSGNETIHA